MQTLRICYLVAWQLQPFGGVADATVIKFYFFQ